MTALPFSYDPDENVIRLDGRAGATIMLGILTRAKFGEPNDPLTLFNRPLAELLRALVPAGASARDTDQPGYDAAFLLGIARTIVSESYRSGWWTQSRDEQRTFLQEVVAAPHRFTERELEFLFEEIDSDLFRRRQITDAAKASTRE